MSNQPIFGTVDTVLASRNRLKTKVLHLPNWGGYFIIMELTGKQRDNYEAEILSITGKGRNQVVKPNFSNSRAKLVAKHIVDPTDFDIRELSEYTPYDMRNGNELIAHMEYTATLKEGHTPKLLFNSIQVNDLGDTDATTLQLVYDECKELSGISEKDVEELENGLKNDHSDDYGSN